MRVHALLSWYDEPEDFLYDSVRSLDGVADTLLAVDGAYALFPNGRALSPVGQAGAIHTAAEEIGLAHRIRLRRSLWPSEVAKRSFMFAQAETDIEPGDWYLVHDADEVITSYGNVREQLEDTKLNVGECLLMGPDTGNIAKVWAEDHAPTIDAHRLVCRVRNVFRAEVGIRVGKRHSIYTARDGRVLWGEGQEKAEALDVMIDHRTEHRPQGRKEQALAYYRERDRLGVEA